MKTIPLRAGQRWRHRIRGYVVTLLREREPGIWLGLRQFYEISIPVDELRSTWDLLVRGGRLT